MDQNIPSRRDDKVLAASGELKNYFAGKVSRSDYLLLLARMAVYLNKTHRIY